jgi:hypothetical protein
MSRSLHALLTAVVVAGEIQRDPIPDSDLDDEQPITLTISCTLGQLRQARAAVHGLKSAGASIKIGYAPK